MARNYYVFGETLVSVVVYGTTSELGLAEEEIVITPRFIHEDIIPDDFAPDCPANVMWKLADATIRMTLVHYDDAVLRNCVASSMGSATGFEGMLPAIGRPMGSNAALKTSTNRFIELQVGDSGGDEDPWVFPSAYLAAMPMEMPLGTKRSLVKLTWRAVPYRMSSEELSDGTVLWRRFV